MGKLESINAMFNGICKAYTELEEKYFIQVCDENDFIVGTPIIKEQLKELLPDDANIYVDMHIEPDKIYMIKKCVLHPDYQKTWIDFESEDKCEKCLISGISSQSKMQNYINMPVHIWR